MLAWLGDLHEIQTLILKHCANWFLVVRSSGCQIFKKAQIVGYLGWGPLVLGLDDVCP